MKITKIKPIGYCKGVYQAINTVYDVVKQYPHLPIYCMGQIVHNDFINHQFEKLGVHIITKNKMQFLHSIEKGVVIFSAHGTSQDLLKKAQEKNLIVINTICPYVLKEMNIVQKYVNEGFEILYIGKKNHPEAEAICSISANIHLIETMEDAKKFQINHSKLFLTNQSTLSITNLYEFFQYFKKKYPQVVISDEICSATRVRQEAVINLDSSVDGVLVIGDSHSNNCTNLYLLAKKQKKDAKMISSKKDLDFQWLQNKTHVALLSGTSTPLEIIKEIENELKKQFF